MNAPAPLKPRSKSKIQQKPVIEAIGRLLIPFILMFALYVQFHGDFGPGGGFQAGVIFAAGLVLYGMIFGPDLLSGIITPRMVEVLLASGVLLYGGVGVASLLLGGNFLDYNVLDSHDPHHGQHLGILLVEAGVGITVAAAVLAVYFSFTGYERR